jgi:hypothetical protein
MSFVVKSRATGLVVATLTSVEEALIADSASHLRVDAHGASDVKVLAAARCEASPDYCSLPDRDEQWVTYTAKSGRTMLCEVVRLLAPDAQGYPSLIELVNPARPESSFIAQASNAVAVERGMISDELWAVLTTGAGEVGEEAEKPKLTKGLRRE